MKENKFLSIIAGIIIGFLLGTFFYLAPTKLLFSGPINNNELFLPSGMQEVILALSAKYGGITGIIIGIIVGYSTPITLPRGHMSKTISFTCFFVCSIMAFIQHGHFLTEISPGRIAMLVIFMFFVFIFSVPIGGMISFIERMREL
jgi:hypothetical protein